MNRHTQDQLIKKFVDRYSRHSYAKNRFSDPEEKKNTLLNSEVTQVSFTKNGFFTVCTIFTVYKEFERFQMFETATGAAKRFEFDEENDEVGETIALARAVKNFFRGKSALFQTEIPLRHEKQKPDIITDLLTKTKEVSARVDDLVKKSASKVRTKLKKKTKLDEVLREGTKIEVSRTSSRTKNVRVISRPRKSLAKKRKQVRSKKARPSKSV